MMMSQRIPSLLCKSGRSTAVMAIELLFPSTSTTRWLPQQTRYSSTEYSHQEVVEQQQGESITTKAVPLTGAKTTTTTATTLKSPPTTTKKGTNVNHQQMLARKRREQRQQRHQALMAQQAEAKELRRLERQRKQERLRNGKQQQQQLPQQQQLQQPRQQNELPTDDIAQLQRRQLDMKNHQALHQALVQELSRQHHLKANQTSTGRSTTHATLDPKQQQYHNVTMAIPSWFSRSPECFDWTMTALQSLGMNHPGSSSPLSAQLSSSSTNPPDFLIDNFRRLYHQSLSSFRMYLVSGHSENNGNNNGNNHNKLQQQEQQQQVTLPPPLQNALDQLLQAGFGDVAFVKNYQSTVAAQPKIKQMRLDLHRMEKAHQQDVKYFPELKSKLQDLKQKKQLEQVQEQDQQKQQQAAVQEESKPKSLIDWSQAIMSFVFGPSKHPATASSEATPGTTPSEPLGMSIPGTISTKSSSSAPTSRRLRRQLMSLSDHVDQLERVVEQMEKKMTYRVQDIQRIQKMLEQTANATLPPVQFQAAYSTVQKVLPDLCQGLAQHIKERFGTVIRAYQLLSSQTDLTRPHDWYLHARMNRRKIIYHGGPTNSGKTYTALQRLKTAKRGLYLAPLRLLAAEVYDTLTMQGVYCNLLTGQDKREVPFSTHSACTIEMASTQTEFDVVVIDEIQMIADESRGNAWTRALLSLRCKEIHVCGGFEAKEIIQKLAEACGDEFELHTYRRFSELRIAPESIAKTPNEVGCYRTVQPGDCIVAFSRNDIFAIKREIEKFTKHKCCVVYGSLPPQIRSEQARRFNDPESGYDILVASDAIGMGLNLNIRRIIFHTMYKSNGERIVKLDHSSVKQIAGRAGRRNSPFPDGEVTCRDPRDMEHLKQCMSTEITPIRQAGLMPTAAHIELFHAALQAGLGLEAKAPTQLHQLLPMFNELAVVQGNYFLCRQNSMQLIATVLSKYDLPLSEKYTFCMAPLDSSASIPMNTLKNFAQKRMECAEAGLPWRDVPRQAKTFEDLSYLCTIYSQLELFLWLQSKFNRNALEIQTALARKEATTAFINTALQDAEKLQLNHCYLKRDRSLRVQWERLNRRNRDGPANDNRYQPPGSSSDSLDFGDEVDDLSIAGNDAAQGINVASDIEQETNAKNNNLRPLDGVDGLLLGDEALSGNDDGLALARGGTDEETEEDDEYV